MINFVGIIKMKCKQIFYMIKKKFKGCKNSLNLDIKLFYVYNLLTTKYIVIFMIIVVVTWLQFLIIM